MANPQLENGYTCIAHEILEALSKINLSPYQSRVLWVVLRKTYGHHRKTDRIAVSQIALTTGLDRRNASRALRTLKERRIIAVEGDRIGLQKDHEKWRDATPKGRRGVSRNTGGVSPETVFPENTKRCLQRLKTIVSEDTTKDIETKDNVKHKASHPNGSDPRVKEVIAWFLAEYRNRFNVPYHVNYGKHGKLIKDLLRTFDVEEIKARAIRLWESEDPFISRTDRGIGILALKINELAPVLYSTQPGFTAPRRDLRYGS
ncbi:MAG TPA: replication protein [Candidatus Eisenbacteria bacterium]|nr:replication protein [Candidatus Eisenbacteria bacterium]